MGNQHIEKLNEENNDRKKIIRFSKRIEKYMMILLKEYSYSD